MALHRLAAVTIGVPNVVETAEYYAEFGLDHTGDGRFCTADGGEQLRLAEAPQRALLAMTVGADDTDDIAQIRSRLRQMGSIRHSAGHDWLTAVEPIAGFTVRIEVMARIEQPAADITPVNLAGRVGRLNERSPVIARNNPVRPRKLGHVVIGSVDYATTRYFFTEGLGFKVTDSLTGRGAFMRCSSDHHNVFVQTAPVNFLHHTSWQVDDVDEVGRGAMAMLEQDPARHVWGLGRHHVGSNFFWYLKDPAGNFSEYYSDMDCILDDAFWKPETFDGLRGLYNWGPPPPPSFLEPDDLAALMVGAHADV